MGLARWRCRTQHWAPGKQRVRVRGRAGTLQNHWRRRMLRHDTHSRTFRCILRSTCCFMQSPVCSSFSSFLSTSRRLSFPFSQSASSLLRRAELPQSAFFSQSFLLPRSLSLCPSSSPITLYISSLIHRTTPVPWSTLYICFLHLFTFLYRLAHRPSPS